MVVARLIRIGVAHCALAAGLALLCRCGEPGVEPVGPVWHAPEARSRAASTLRTTLATIPSTIVASPLMGGSVVATVRDTVTGLPAAGVQVRFTTTRGVIRPSATTDTGGVASVLLRGEARNGPVVVRAWVVNGADTVDSVTALTRFDGVRIVVSVKGQASVGVATAVRLQLIDGAGLAIAAESLSLDGFVQAFAVTDGNGEAEAQILPSAAGDLRIRASARGASVETVLVARQIAYSDSVCPDCGLELSTPADSMRATAFDSLPVAAAVYTPKRNPVQGVRVVFSTDQGVITPVASTDSSGRAFATLRGSPRAGVANIRASMMLIPTIASTARIRLVAVAP